MPSCTSHVNNFFKSFDLFSYGQFFRYNGAGSYTTFSGGLVSIGVMVILIVLLANMGIKTVKKEIIFTSQSTDFADDPSKLTIDLSPEGGFMFALYIFDMNITNSTQRAFDVKMYQDEYTPLLQLTNSTELPLVQCT